MNIIRVEMSSHFDVKFGGNYDSFIFFITEAQECRLQSIQSKVTDS